MVKSRAAANSQPVKPKQKTRATRVLSEKSKKNEDYASDLREDIIQEEMEEDEDEYEAADDSVEKDEIDLDNEELRLQDEDFNASEDEVEDEEEYEEEQYENGEEAEDEEEDEETEVPSDDENAVTFSRDSPGFWVLRLDRQCREYIWHVDGAAELNETDFQKDPDFVEMSLEISQITIDHRTPLDEVQCVQVATRGTVSGGNKPVAEWYTIAFLSGKHPFISTRLVFSPPDRPVAFRLATGKGPVTLVGRLIRRVNELPVKEALELSEAVGQAELVPQEEEEEEEEEEEVEEEQEQDEEIDEEKDLEAFDDVDTSPVKTNPIKRGRRPLTNKTNGSLSNDRPFKRNRQMASPQDKTDIQPPAKKSRNLKSRNGR